ncbi:MAG: methyltransferase domain-containing protein [Victivallales bacterium]|jgi:16S rRNA (cytosine967-C5)-methyltransferase|nr:methyltransferase domain-containing protein [Victivallales bacterium]
MRKVASDTATHVLSDASKVLALIENGEQSLDDALDSSLTYPELRRTVSSLLFFYFRRKKLIDRWITSLAARPPRPRLRRLLSIVLTQIRCQSKIAPESAVNVAVDLVKAEGKLNESKFVNAVLRRAVTDMPELADAPDEVLPNALLKKWRKTFSAEEIAQMCRAFLVPAGFTFRAEHGFEPPEEWQLRQIPNCGDYRFFESSAPGVVLESEALKHGKIYIQDPATALAPSLPDMTNVKSVLDVCAAPGGKALLLSERMRADAVLVAADRSARRQKYTRENFRCRGLAFQVVVAEARELTGSFDLVFADVPCSNTGVFRHRPDAVWRFNESEQKRITALQYEILESAAELVAPNGQLIYSTCSVEPEENAGQIERFIARHSEFEIVAQKQLLPGIEHDGAYACLLKRRAKSIRK